MGWDSRISEISDMSFFTFPNPRVVRSLSPLILLCLGAPRVPEKTGCFFFFFVIVADTTFSEIVDWRTEKERSRRQLKIISKR